MPKLRRYVLTGLMALCGLLVLASHGGALHPAGDSVAIAAPLFALFGLAASEMLRARLATLIFGGWLAVWGYQTFAPTGPPGDLALYQKNMLYRNSALPQLAEDIIASGADVVTLQELSDQNKAILPMLAATFPHQHICDFWRWADLAVLSRHPITKSGCSARRALAWASIERDGQAFSAASIHLPWPYPYGQAARLSSIEPDLAALPQPVVIGADFNTFPNTRVTRRIAQLTGTRELRQLEPTYFLGRLPLYLDHVMAPSGEVERRPRLGSDHYGLLGRLSLGEGSRDAF